MNYLVVVVLIVGSLKAGAKDLLDESNYKNIQHVEQNKIQMLRESRGELNNWLSTKQIAELDPNIADVVSAIYYFPSDVERAKNKLKEVEKRIDQGHKIWPLVRFFVAQSYCAKNFVEQCILICRSLLAEAKRGEWQIKIVSLLVEALFELKRFAEIEQLFNSISSQYFSGNRDESVSRKVAESLRITKNFKEESLVLEKIARVYPTSETSRWAFNRLLELSCIEEKAKRYYFSLELLIDIGRNANLDDGIPEMLVALSSDRVRDLKDEVRYLTKIEQSDLLFKMRLFDESAEIRIDAYESAKHSSDLNSNNALVTSIGRIYLRSFRPDLALIWANKFFSTQEITDNSQEIVELYADIYKYLGMYRLASDQFKFAMASRSTPVNRWDYFWNTYRSANYGGAYEFLVKYGTDALRHGDPEQAIDYWLGKSLHASGRLEEANDYFAKILRSESHSPYVEFVAAKYQINGLDGLTDGAKHLATDQSKLFSKLIDRRPDVSKFNKVQNYHSIVTNIQQALGNFQNNQITRMLRKSDDVIFFSNYMPDIKILSEPDFLSDVRKFEFVSRKAPRDFFEFQNYQVKNFDLWIKSFPLAYFRHIEIFAKKYRIDPLLVLSVIRVESLYNNYAQSAVGAVGLMQIMPYTAIKIARNIGDNEFQISGLFDPELNIKYGTFYLSQLNNFYLGNVVVAAAAYNAGPEAVNFWLKSCNGCSSDEFIDFIPYRETRNYVKRVLKSYANYRRIYSDKPTLDRFPDLPEDLPRHQEIF